MDSTVDHLMSGNIMNDSMGREEGERLLQDLINEMNDQNFDAIKFASYRTAAKLLFIQKKTNLHLVDVYNMIESFRENGLNTLDHNTELHESRLEAIVSSIFYALNKRLPTTHNVDVERSIALVTNWLLCAYDGDAIGRIRVLSVKTALSSMCAGRLIDKLRYAFSQIEDDRGVLNFPKFEAYLRELLQLPAVVGEAPTFGFSEEVVNSLFKPEGNLKRSETVLIDFLENTVAKDPPRCYVWLTTLQKIATAQKTQHQIECQVCRSKPVVGLRYKCLHCYNYTLCQDCFWRGKTSSGHTPSHDMREYSSWKTGEPGSTFKSKFLCGSKKKRPPLPEFPSEPEPNKTLDMTNIVPPLPTEFSTPNHAFDYVPTSPSPDSYDSSLASQPTKHSDDFETRIDDEHKLISRYAARLAANARGKTPSKAGSQLSIDSNRESRELIQTLENKNRLLLKEIRRLRDEHDEASRSAAQIARNPELLAELKVLRQRKDELELRMSALQESRRELMVQLEGLMNMLKAGSPRPPRSPKAESSSTPDLHVGKPRHASDPGSGSDSQQALSGVDGDIKQAFGEQGGDHTGNRDLRNDLLHAADSVTSAMSSLVKELNSVISELELYRAKLCRSADYHGVAQFLHEGENSNVTESSDVIEDPELRALKLEVNKMTESLELDKRTRHETNNNLTNGDVTNRGAPAVIVHAPYKKAKHQADSLDSLPRGGHATDDESYIQTDDDEGNFRTDDEELEWQESMRRWANR